MAEAAIDWPSLLREFRQTRGLKQEAAAAHFGVSQASISRWESGVVAPTVAVRNRLFKALRCSRSPIDTADWLATFRQMHGIGGVYAEDGILRAATSALAYHVGVPRDVMEGLRLDQMFTGDVLEVFEELTASGVFTGRLANFEACVHVKVDPCIRRGVGFHCHYIAWPHFNDDGAIVLVNHGEIVSADQAHAQRERLGGALRFALAA